MKKSTFNLISKFGDIKKNHSSKAFVSNNMMYFSDGDNTAAASISLSGPDGMIDISDLKKVFSRGDVDSIKMGGGKADLAIGKKSFKLNADEDGFYESEIKGIIVNDSFTITEEILRAQKFLSKDELRPAMCGIHFSKENKQICTTDAHRMYFVSCDPGFGADIVLNKMFFNIPIGTYCVYEHEKSVTFVNKDYRFTIAKIDERYPAYSNVITTSFNTVFTYSKAEFKELINDALVCANQTTTKILLTGQGDVKSQDIDLNKEFEARAETFVNKEGFEVDIYMSGKFLLTCLDAIESDLINIEITAPNRAVIINNCVLLMPIM